MEDVRRAGGAMALAGAAGGFAAALAALAAALGALGAVGAAAQDAERLSAMETVRVTGATVLRGGPASPPVALPGAMEGRVVGMRGDTILFETGAEPVYWIPLGAGPLVERRGTVTDLKRSVIVGASVSALAGATFAWALRDQCNPNRAAVELGLIPDNCPDTEPGGRAALRGFAVGAAAGAAAGALLSRFARRQGWIPVRLEGLTFVGPAGSVAVGAGVVVRVR